MGSGFLVFPAGLRSFIYQLFLCHTISLTSAFLFLVFDTYLFSYCSSFKLIFPSSYFSPLPPLSETGHPCCSTLHTVEYPLNACLPAKRVGFMKVGSHLSYSSQRALYALHTSKCLINVCWKTAHTPLGECHYSSSLILHIYLHWVIMSTALRETNLNTREQRIKWWWG